MFALLSQHDDFGDSEDVVEVNIAVFGIESIVGLKTGKC